MKKLIFVILCLAMLIIRLARNYYGYCESNGVQMSDEQYIAIAYRHVQNTSVQSVQISDYSKEGLPVIRFAPASNVVSSTTDLFVNGNACCSVVNSGSEGFQIGIAEKLFGNKYKIIKVNHRVKYLNSVGLEQQLDANSFVSISRCGSVIRD